MAEKRITENEAAAIKEMRPFLTAQEAAVYLDMELSSVYNYVHYNRIPFYKTATGKLRFKRSELDDWVFHEKHPVAEAAK